MADEMIVCEVCGKEFKTQEEHDTHHISEHGGAPEGEKMSEDGDNKTM